MMKPFASVRALAGAFALGLLVAACGQSEPETKTTEATPTADAGVVNLYTARHYDSDLRLYERFTELTGIRVNRIEGNPDTLIARMQSEGEASPADVFVAADAGALWRVQDAGLFQPANSTTLQEAIPANLREPGGHWYGFSRRARIVAYDSAKVRPEEVDTYEELASPRFRGKLCVRSSDSVYNLSLVGALIEVWGEEKTREWVDGIVANMARQPEGGDRDQIRAVGAGICEVAITNSYYYIRLASGEDAGDREITERVKLAFPSLDGRGAHVNISGGGVAANAPNFENAVKLLEFLASPEAQSLVAEYNNEYPASPSVTVPAPVSTWAPFEAHPMSVARYGPRQAAAQAMMSRAGWR